MLVTCRRHTSSDHHRRKCHRQIAAPELTCGLRKIRRHHQWGQVKVVHVCVGVHVYAGVHVYVGVHICVGVHAYVGFLAEGRLVAVLCAVLVVGRICGRTSGVLDFSFHNPPAAKFGWIYVYICL